MFGTLFLSSDVGYLCQEDFSKERLLDGNPQRTTCFPLMGRLSSAQLPEGCVGDCDSDEEAIMFCSLKIHS